MQLFLSFYNEHVTYKFKYIYLFSRCFFQSDIQFRLIVHYKHDWQVLIEQELYSNFKHYNKLMGLFKKKQNATLSVFREH